MKSGRGSPLRFRVEEEVVNFEGARLWAAKVASLQPNDRAGKILGIADAAKPRLQRQNNLRLI